MIIVLKKGIDKEKYHELLNFIEKRDVEYVEIEGVSKRIIGIIGNKHNLDKDAITAFPGVERVIPILEPYKLASRKFHPTNSIIKVGEAEIGGLEPVRMAGPCSVESEEQIWEIAENLSKQGVQILRGGIFKPRSSPYSFQGVGEIGLPWLRDAGKHYGMPVISEVMQINQIELMYDYVDIFQVGARNMQNFRLLEALGKTDKPIMLKRGIAATFNEFLMSAEYILSNGNDKVILCERGIRTFVEYTRNTLDVNVIPMVKNVSHLPIIVDPSHATGRTDIITQVTLGSLIAGADGFIIEVHPRPYAALSDGAQQLTFEQYAQFMEDYNLIRESLIKLREKKFAEINEHVSNSL